MCKHKPVADARIEDMLSQPKANSLILYAFRLFSRYNMSQLVDMHFP